MKKFIATLCAMALIFTIFTPAMANDGRGKLLEELILKAKSVIDIPQELTEFRSSMNTSKEGRTSCWLNWTNEETMPGKRIEISVQIDQDGFITSYSKYLDSIKYTGYVQIPEISKDQAKAKVDEFIDRVVPQIKGQIHWNYSHTSDGSYSFSGYRIINGIPAKFNNVNFRVNGTTAEVMDYYSNWDTSLTFPDSQDIVSIEKAKEAYESSMPLDLEYRINDEGNVYLQYTASRQFRGYYINAKTGEAEKGEPYYHYSGYERAQYMDMAAKSSMRAGLTPSEQKEVTHIDGAISVDEAEKKLRSIKGLDFGENYVLVVSDLYQVKNAYEKEPRYIISLSFEKAEDGLSHEDAKKKIADGEGVGHAYAQFDAMTGELISFSTYSYIPKTKEEAKFNKAESKDMVDEFVGKMTSDRFTKLKYIEEDNESPGYSYYRVENGAYFDFDGVTVSINPENKKINNYNLTWNKKVQIPGVENVIDSQSAHAAMFEQAKFNLEYILNKDEVVLVYKLSDELPNMLDAFTGKLIDGFGKPYDENENKAEYSDIEGHFSEAAVKELINVGVFLKGDTFEPDSNVLQKDFVSFLVKVGNYYYSRDNIEEIYNYLVNSEVMTQEEINPEGTVTREDAVKYVLRFLGYKKFAEIPGIFYCEFADIDQITPELFGYAAIAKGLGIINGSDGNFHPKALMTRGEMAVIIYNCLKTGVASQ
jgi:hypothetical protein